ncbi:YhgE/Pip family protein [Paratractidigestivibacter faecalis]|uniref:YhgE/Pip family protein n=1 Tax=Paratractidigestivibacter faecalis TaxID=2292441 RepID=UPI003A954D3F
MRKAFQIFKRDLRRLLKNPVAVIVTIGVAIIPSLYAWFNILANWDPYENTSTVPIAVVIDDEGAEVGDMGQINAGDMIREQLEENTQLGWTFLDSEDEAVEGVRSGRYYAAFVVPSDFTASLGDIVDGDVSPAHISYYVNEKANAVAPKVTDTGSTTLDNEITDQFLEVAGKTVTEKLQDAMGGAATKADETRDTVVTDLRDVSGTLAGLADGLDGAQSTLADARATVAQARATLQDLSGSATRVSGSLTDALGTLSDTRAKATSLAAQLSGALGSGAGSLSGISADANHAIGQVTGSIGWAQGKLDGAISQVGSVSDDTLGSLATSLGRVYNKVDALPDGTPGKADALAALDDAIAQVKATQADLAGKVGALKQVSSDIKDANDTVGGLADSVNDAIQGGASSLSGLQQQVSGTTMPALSAVLDDVSAGAGQLAGGVSALSPMLDQADATLSQLDGILAQCASSVAGAASSVRDAGQKVGSLANDVAAIEGLQTVGAVSTVLDLDPKDVGTFLGSPAQLVTESVFPVANYGSNVTPFYTNLALWVGGFVLVAIYKLEVDDEGVGDFKPWQGFFGRWLLLNLIGQLQAIICCVGDLCLGIQCVSPVAFVFAGMVESFVYVFFIYALSVAFKHIGKALGVLLVVLQIPGASGLYPIEMQPGFFQALKPWLPFTYGINAMRESVAGFYGCYYAQNLGMLLVFLIPALLVGVAARRHLLNINALFDHRLAETDLMISERTDMEGARFRLSTIVKALMDSGGYKRTFMARVAHFELRYPVYVKRGFAALIIVPLALTALMFVLPAKFGLMIVWVISLVVICTFLIVVEYLHSRVGQKTTLADMSREELYGLLDAELKEEFMAFAPLEKIRLDREAEQDGTPGPANPLSDAPTMAGRTAADKGASAQDGDGQKGGEDR